MPQPILSLLSLALATALIPQNTHGFSTKPFSRPKDTKVTAAGKSTATVIPPSTALSDHNVTLTNYMRLPVEQYVLIPMPLGSSLTRIKNKNNMDDDDGGGGRTRTTTTRRRTTIMENSYTDNDDNNGDNANEEDGAGEEFELVVPTITFFNLSLQPVVYASVYPQQNKVIISSDKCLLRGSPFIEKVKLNDRFDFNVCCTLTWEDTLVASQSSLDNAGGKDGHEVGTTTQFNDMTLEMQQTHDANNLSEFMKNKDNNNDVHGKTTQQQQQQQRQCSITAETTIHVDVNVPRPFNSLPKIVLEKTGSTAMQLSMKYIQGNFVANLANDYEKWATDLEYRLFRASLSSEERAKEEEGKGRIENDDHSVLMELEETF